ncbi:MAG: hypothetical protein U0944_00190 [Candidatus Moranbacteria bacterium]|nr:hypothetical protein [bacterium]MDP1833784.1 hypothetical protein [Candidatus Moranbacteria bacterium]MDZ4384823.1 hypothetical protein [Candidatus Moranbacteria bacterium]
MDNLRQKDLDAREKRRKMNDLQREMMMLEADLKKTVKEKTLIEAEERKIKKETDYLKIALQKSQIRLQTVERDIVIKQAEINRLKKQVNSL